VGDAFGSTFTAGYEIFNCDIKKAMLIAAKNTASVIGEQGAQNGLLTRRGVMAVLKK
jgi:sugar/nucleoside kinase (ribokinase family)